MRRIVLIAIMAMFLGSVMVLPAIADTANATPVASLAVLISDCAHAEQGMMIVAAICSAGQQPSGQLMAMDTCGQPIPTNDPQTGGHGNGYQNGDLGGNRMVSGNYAIVPARFILPMFGQSTLNSNWM